MSTWTGSATDRVFACPASLALPAVFEQGGRDATDGHTVHGFLYRGLTLGRPTALAWLRAEEPELVPRCEAISLDSVFRLGDTFAAEVAYAYDVATDTARIIGTNLGRRYGRLGATEIPTTTDIELRAPVGVVVILDAKSGWRQVSARDSMQIRMHALAVSRARGLDRVRVGILQIDDEGTATAEVLELDDMELDAFSFEVRQAWGRVEAARAELAAGRVPDVATGDHCRYCPAWASCPSRVALARSTLSLEAATVKGQIEAMTPDEAGDLWLRYKVGEELLEVIGVQLRAYAERAPLQLADGRTVEMVPQRQVRSVMVPSPDGATKVVEFLKATVRGGPKKPRKRKSTDG